ALLKIIEEPPKDTYFILLANSLNILPTIKSRSLAIEIQKLTHEELGVEESLYNFFLGDVKDIREFKSGAYTLSKESYKNTAIYMKEYLETGEFLPKIRAYGALEDFILEKSYLSEIDKIAFAETLDKAIGKNRDFLEHILYQMTLKSRNLKKLEYLLELKEMIRYNVNISVLLVNFILNI
nr:ATPase [Fusobacteriaceae bacterium]